MARTIERNDWTRVFNDLSRDYDGHTAIVEIREADTVRTLADNVSFAGIDADTKDGENCILVTLGNTKDEHITHVVEQPSEVHVEGPSEQNHTSVQIAASDGSTTVIHLQ